MNILAADTATSSCSVCVLGDHGVLAEITVDNKETHTRHIMKIVEEAVAKSKLSLKDMDGFAVTIGPGSFTGIRIGLSTIKGLAFASDKPVIGVSSLEALGDIFPFSRYPVRPMIDARRGEVYWSDKEKGEEKVTSPEAAVEDIAAPCILVGSGAVCYRDIILEKLQKNAVFPPASYNTIRASAVANIALRRLQAGESDDLAALIPCYIRKSEAEIMLEKRMKASQQCR